MACNVSQSIHLLHQRNFWRHYLYHATGDRVSRLYPGFFVYHSALLRGFIVAFAVAILHLQMQFIEQFRAQVVRTNTADFKFPCRCDLYYTGISLAFLNIRVFDGFLDNVLHTHVPLPPRVEHDLSRVWKMIGRYDGQKD